MIQKCFLVLVKCYLLLKKPLNLVLRAFLWNRREAQDTNSAFTAVLLMRTRVHLTSGFSSVRRCERCFSNTELFEIVLTSDLNEERE